MKKIAIVITSVFLAMGAHAQEPGSYLIVGGGMGMSGFTYATPNLQNVSHKLGLGFHGNVGYSYFFNQHWGLGVGLQVGSYSTTIKFSEYRYSKDGLLDYEQLEDPAGSRTEYYRQDIYLNPHQLDNYDNYYDESKPSLLGGSWQERQRALILDIPLQLLFQHRFNKRTDSEGRYYKQDEYGAKSRWGVYANLGLKLQVPLNTSFKADGRVVTEAVFSDYYLPLYDLVDRDHGFFERGYGTSGKQSMKVGLAGAAELGLLYALRPCIDLYVGAYADVGFTTVNKVEKDKSIVYASAYLNEEGKTRNGVRYQSVINSSEAGNAKNLSLGGKIGLRFRLGGCRERKGTYLAPSQGCDTVYIYRDTCPEKVAAAVIAEPTLVELEDLYEVVNHFSNTTARMDEYRKAQVQRKIDIMKKYPNMEITLVGHTCDYGTDESNMMLGMRRAQHLRDYMVSQGVDPDNISIDSKGFREPCVPNTTEENRRINRRVEVWGKHRRDEMSGIVYKPAPNEPAPVVSTMLDSLKNESKAYLKDLRSATRLVSAANSAPNLAYKIQVSTTQAAIADINKTFGKYNFTYKVEEEINEYLTAVTYVYLTGNFERYDEARSELQRIRRDGISDAFIVPYYNGSRISMNEANELAQEAAKKQN